MQIDTDFFFFKQIYFLKIKLRYKWRLETAVVITLIYVSIYPELYDDLYFDNFHFDPGNQCIIYFFIY